MIQDVHQLMAERFETEGVPVKKGLVELLHYLKDNNLYVIPVVLATISENEKITPVANNLIVDRYNGKE